MAAQRPIRWGILGTANIARSSFLPGLRWAEGAAHAVGGRDLTGTQQYAAANGIEHAWQGYDAVVADEEVDAVYIPLPNSLHAEWIVRSLEAGKAVLCEKPLCLSVAQTEAVLDVARRSPRPLWEAFVFPWRRQTHRVLDIIRSGQIGEIREIHSSFHFQLRNPEDIRLDPDLGGGATYDVGCYPTIYANMLFNLDPLEAVSMARWTSRGVDIALQGVLDFSGERRLLMSCGMDSPQDTFTRLLGSEGEIRLTNPWHPTARDTLEIHRGDGIETEHPNGNEPSFGPAIAHIQGVLRGETQPEHLAIDESLPNAKAIELLLDSANRIRQPA